MLQAGREYVRLKKSAFTVHPDKLPTPSIEEIVLELSKPAVGGTMNEKRDILRYFSDPLPGVTHCEKYVREYIILQCKKVYSDLPNDFEKVIPLKVDWSRKKSVELAQIVADLHGIFVKLMDCRTVHEFHIDTV